MGISQINAIRASIGLPAVTVDNVAKQKAAKRRADNHAARAQANRDMKSKRTGRSK